MGDNKKKNKMDTYKCYCCDRNRCYNNKNVL